MNPPALNTTNLLNQALLAELSYLSFSRLTDEEHFILKSSDFGAKRPILSKLIEEQFKAPRNTQLLQMIQTFDFLDLYSEKLFHSRQMIAVRETNSNQTIFAIRGTLVTSIRDIFTDINFGIRKLKTHPKIKSFIKTSLILSPLVPGTTTVLATSTLFATLLSSFSKAYTVDDYLDEAKIFIKKILMKHQIKHEDITVVGHSLGAIFAQMIAAHAHTKGVGFNGFTLDQTLFDERQLKNVHENFLNFSFDKDILSNLGDRVFGKQVGHTYKIQSFEKENAISAHSMSNFTTNLVRFSEIKKITNSNLDIDQLSKIIEDFGRKEFLLASIIKILHHPELSFHSITKSEKFKAHQLTPEKKLITLLDKIICEPKKKTHHAEFISFLDKSSNLNKKLSKNIVR